MNESDAFIVKEEKYMNEPVMDEMNYMDEDLYDEDLYDEEYGNPMMDEMNYMDEEDTLYEVDFPESGALDPNVFTDSFLMTSFGDANSLHGQTSLVARMSVSRFPSVCQEWDSCGGILECHLRSQFYVHDVAQLSVPCRSVFHHHVVCLFRPVSQQG
jgi:hypothetical protein